MKFVEPWDGIALESKELPGTKSLMMICQGMLYE